MADILAATPVSVSLLQVGPHILQSGDEDTN